MDDLNLLMLLGQYVQYQDNEILYGAIDLLLKHWQREDHLYGFGVGKRFRALEYPPLNTASCACWTCFPSSLRYKKPLL